MLNKDFLESKHRQRINHLYNTITRQLGKDLDNNLLSKILDYISIEKQVFIKVCKTPEEFCRIVFNGYTHNWDSKGYNLQNQTCIDISDNVQIGYHQHKKINKKTTLVNNFKDSTVVIYTCQKGYTLNHNQTTPVYDKFTSICFLKGAENTECEYIEQN